MWFHPWLVGWILTNILSGIEQSSTTRTLSRVLMDLWSNPKSAQDRDTIFAAFGWCWSGLTSQRLCSLRHWAQGVGFGAGPFTSLGESQHPPISGITAEQELHLKTQLIKAYTSIPLLFVFLPKLTL